MNARYNIGLETFTGVLKEASIPINFKKKKKELICKVIYNKNNITCN
uniref:Uncharacterized protein n=1 Tax=Rhizophora mucronata TaxID=61149 RepID=A0A2P2M5G9_RHIMU